MVEELTGYTPEEVIGRPLAHFLHPNDRTAIGEAIRRAEDSPDCPTCEVVREDGKKVGSIV